MSTIEHEGKTYEVLTLHRISEITHAKLAGGKVVKAEGNHAGVKVFATPSSAFHFYYIDELADYGIQPLRLVPKEPVVFEGEAEWLALGYEDVEVIRVRVKKADWHSGFRNGMKFQLTQIVEEAK